jgi:hypothetical protein
MRDRHREVDRIRGDEEPSVQDGRDPVKLEQLLTEELHAVAAEAVPPRLSSELLVRAGNREKARRRRQHLSLGALGLTAAAAAVIVASALVPRASDSSPPAVGTPAPTVTAAPTPAPSLDQMPEGPSAEVPYRQDGDLTIGTSHVETDLPELLFSGGTTLVGRATPVGSHWELVAGDRLLPTIDTSTQTTPVVSPDGALVAWAEPVRDGTARLVLWDVMEHAEVAGIDQEVEPGSALTVISIDSEGRVFYDLGGTTYLWSATSPGTAVRGIVGDQIAGGWPGGLMRVNREVAPATDSFTPGTVDDSGLWSPSEDRPLNAEPYTFADSVWSPDGAYLAHSGNGASDARPSGAQVWVVDQGQNALVRRMQLPPDVRQWAVLGWESATSLVLVALDHPSAGAEHLQARALIRCAADTGGCERTQPTVSGTITGPSQPNSG